MRKKKAKAFVISEIDGLLLNISAGLAPEDFTISEKKLLVERFGRYWMCELGYTTNPNYLQIILNK